MFRARDNNARVHARTLRNNRKRMVTMAITLELDEQETISISVALIMYLDAMSKDPDVIKHAEQGIETIDIHNCKNILQNVFTQMEQRKTNE
jgi:hypothetical protein